jgi:S1-C subfamily serine protease
VNGLDLLLLALLVVAGYLGYRRGLTLQVFALGGLLLGLLVGALVAPVAAEAVESPAARAGVAALVLLTFAGVGNALGWFAGSHVRLRAASRLGKADAVAGSAVSVLASLLAIWFLALNLVNGPFPALAAQVRGSAVVRVLDAALPEPPSLLAQVGRFFKRFGFPDVFTGIPPLPAEPVEPPTQAQARAAALAASESTLRVVGQACDSLQQGSGFVAADAYVVTSAHVVAGMDDPQVQGPGELPVDAVPVVFDPDLDLAILRVAGPAGAPLALAFEALPRGSAGAVLGYPEGGNLEADPAAVRRTIEAVGRDIYGQGQVERLVVELQAHVHPGNSGGPFVLADGRVGGVVFAASSGDDQIAYALAASEVRDALAVAVQRTGEVDTGPCLR